MGNVKFETKRAAEILDIVGDKFKDVLGTTWDAQITKNKDGTLAGRMHIWNGKDSFRLECNDDRCELSKITYVKQQGFTAGFLWGCAQQIPAPWEFSEYVGAADIKINGGNLQDIKSGDGAATAGDASGDICKEPEGMCLVPKPIDVKSYCDSDGDGKITDKFKDAKLVAVIRAYLKLKTDEDITLDDAIYTKQLSLENSEITDLSGLECFQNLDHIYLQNNDIKNIESLKQITGIRYFLIDQNKISNFGSTISWYKLNGLSAKANLLTNVEPLSNLTSLNWLFLSENNLTNISCLSKLLNLKQLEVAHNQISDISVVKNLPELIELDLSFNKILDIKPLSYNSKKIRKLNLQGNQISDLSSIAKLPDVHFLYLQDNNISDVSPLSSLFSLEQLYLQNNNISDISALIQNPNLGSNCSVNLKGNPNIPLSQIEELKKKGVKVTF